MAAAQPQAPYGSFWQGRDLAAERVRRGMFQREVAARPGVSARRIAALEAAWSPPVEAVQRYLQALEQ